MPSLLSVVAQETTKPLLTKTVAEAGKNIVEKTFAESILSSLTSSVFSAKFTIFLATFKDHMSKNYLATFGVGVVTLVAVHLLEIDKKLYSIFANSPIGRAIEDIGGSMNKAVLEKIYEDFFKNQESKPEGTKLQTLKASYDTCKKNPGVDPSHLNCKDVSRQVNSQLVESLKSDNSELAKSCKGIGGQFVTGVFEGVWKFENLSHCISGSLKNSALTYYLDIQGKAEFAGVDSASIPETHSV